MHTVRQSSWHFTRRFVLTWEIAPEACLRCDHPLRSGFTEDCDGVLGLLPQSCQTIAKLTDNGVQLVVGQPSILAQDQLTGEKESFKT